VTGGARKRAQTSVVFAIRAKTPKRVACHRDSVRIVLPLVTVCASSYSLYEKP
jgi:hypothetical protein